MLSKQDPNLDTPRDAVEQDLLDLWREALKLPNIGIHDNFFELGGDETRSLQIASKALTKGISIKPKDLFGHPTVAELAELVRGSAVQRQSTDSGTPGSFPLSPVQKGMLFHSLSDPGVYLQQLIVELEGPLDESSLRECWREVIAAHEALRAEVVMASVDEPVQRVVESFELPWSSGVASDIELEIERERKLPLDLTKAPPMRLRLIRLEEEAHVLIWTHHHIFIDGWSAGLVMEQVTELYASAPRGDLSPLAPQPSYREFMSRFAEAERTSDADYWRQMLAGVEEPTRIGWEGFGPSSEPGALTIDLSVDESSRLQQFAREERITLSTLLMGAHALALSRAALSSRILTGVTVSGRSAELPDSERCVGMFINTLPAVVDVPDTATVSEWLLSVQDLQLELLDRQHSSLSEIQASSAIPAGTSLFDSIFVFENYPEAKPKSGAVNVRRMRALERPHYPLTVYAAGGSVITIGVNFDGSRVGREAAALVLDQVRISALGLAASSDALLGSLSAPAPASAAAGFDSGRTPVPIRVLERSRTHGAEPAIESAEGDVWTYAELVSRAAGLERQLMRTGVRRGDIVAVCMRRSPEAITAWLGVMQAGAAYLPLDPALPRQRIEFMLSDSGARAVVADRSTSNLFSFDGPLLLTEETGTADPAASIPTSQEDLAYVIYTSGSTGVPKAVCVTHGGLANLVSWHTREYQVVAADRASHLAGLGFDASVWEVWPYLCAGATLCIPDDESRLDPIGLTAWLRDARVAITFVPTPLADALSASEGWDGLPSLRVVLTGGDRLLSRTSDIRLFNHYGPTENTVVATAGRVDPTGAGPPDIGKPIGGVGLYLLDHGLRPSPEGAGGEIFLGGVQVARGYLNRPGLTAERFLPDPFGPPGSRMYRTGDLGRRRPDGTFEFFGRLDDQVKIRGYRIELGEIETTLAGHPSVTQAAALVTENRLIAFVTGLEAEPAILMAHCAGVLPEYMVPSDIVVLDSLPLTPNGKIDRKSLATAAGRPASSSREPRDEVETMLLEIWRKVFRRDAIGVTENFFDLGGDSITAIQIVAQAGSRGVRLTPKQIFAAPTVAGVAELLRESPPDGRTPPEQGPLSGTVPLSPTQRWFLELAGDEVDHFNMPILLKPRERLAEEPLSAALTALVNHHDQLRVRLSGGSGTPVQRIEPQGAATLLERVDLGHMGDAEQDARLKKNAEQVQRSLDLENGPVVRAVLFDLGSRGQRLLMVVHHMAVDAVSWGVIVEDLEAAYELASSGAPVLLPPKTHSFRDWAAAVDRFARSDAARAELDFWLEKLPLDSGPEIEEGTWGDAETEEISVPAELTSRVELACRARGWRTDAALLAVVAGAIGKITGKQEVVFDVEGHGRSAFGDELDVTRTVGWFTVLFPAVVSTGGNLVTTVDRTSQHLASLARGGAGYGALRYLTDDEIRTELASRRTSTAGFNYVGRLDELAGSLFETAGEDTGHAFSPSLKRAHSIDIDAGITSDGMKLSVTHPKDLSLKGFSESLITGLEEVGAAAGDLAGVTDAYPLSPLQEGILFHSLASEDAQYHEQISFWIEEVLDPSLLRKAWARALERHDVLRTSIAHASSGPAQIVHESATLEVQTEDLTNRSSPEQEERLQKARLEDQETPFDLQQAPLMRFRLFRVEAEKWWALWSYHHLILDGWSASILLAELMQDYRALREGESPPTRPRPPRYRDYINLIRATSLDEARRHWQRELDGTAPSLAFSNEGGPSSAGHVDASIDAAQTGAVRALAAEHGVTIAATVHAAWGMLVSRRSSRSDILFGSTTSGRELDLSGIESAVGLFINTLPVRLRVLPDDDLGRILKRVQSQLLDISRLHHTPLVLAQQWAGLSAEVPMFDSVVIVENYPDTDVLPVKVIADDVVESTNYPVTLAVELNGEIKVRLLYDGTNVDREAAARLLDDYMGILTALEQVDVADLAGTASVAQPIPPRRVILDERPMGAVETVVARVWSEVLALDEVRLADRFFELGGHSLSATQVVSRLKDIFGSRLPVRLPFEAPTVAEMADRLVAAAESREKAEAVAAAWLQGDFRPRSGVIPRTTAAAPRAALIQEYAWNLHQLDPTGPTYNVGGAVRYRGALDAAALRRALLTIAERHEPLRAVFRKKDETLVQLAGATEPEIEEIDAPGEDYEETLSLVRAKLGEPFDLARGPLMRASLVRRGPSESILFVGMHHIVTDGWSMGVFQRELAHLYRAYSSGERPRLRPLRIRYSDFAEWQRDSLDRGLFDDQLKWWQTALRDAPPYVDYPTDKPRPPMRTFEGDSVQVDLTPELWQKTRSTAGAKDATPYMVMLGALNIVLFAESGQTDIVTGSPSASRNYVEIEDMIGLFLNNMATRVRIRPSGSFEELIAGVKESVLGAYARTDVPYNRMIQELDIPEDPSRPELYQVSLNMINTPPAGFDLPGIDSEMVLAPEIRAKQDMTLYAQEVDGTLSIQLVYNSIIFDRSRMQRLLDRFLAILGAGCADPSVTVAALAKGS